MNRDAYERAAGAVLAALEVGGAFARHHEALVYAAVVVLGLLFKPELFGPEELQRMTTWCTEMTVALRVDESREGRALRGLVRGLGELAVIEDTWRRTPAGLPA